jgi:hypothetical protein
VAVHDVAVGEGPGGIKTVLGTVLQHVAITGGRIDAIDLASRYGAVQVRADGFVDASGDAALTWQAGLPCWVPERSIYGSQQVIVENVDENHKPDPGEIDAVLAARGEEYGLLRRGGLAFFFPGRGTAVLNVTHIEAPLDPLQAAQAQFDGRAPGAARTTSTRTSCASGWRPTWARRHDPHRPGAGPRHRIKTWTERGSSARSWFSLRRGHAG